MNRLFPVSAAAVAAMLFSGCVTRVSDYTLLSTKSVDAASPRLVVDRAHRVKGVDRRWNAALLFQNGQPQLKTAIDAAIEKRPNCVALSDVVIRHSWWSSIVYGESGIEVEGNPVIELPRPQMKPGACPCPGMRKGDKKCPARPKMDKKAPAKGK